MSALNNFNLVSAFSRLFKRPTLIGSSESNLSNTSMNTHIHTY
uniref:Uncharacterized protein n=1 Tax=Nelumbo nucifera TaxID=4432 RepID=A0A822Z474_NELNU|nr:TPA_asm: hypothetical protein HUJ06_006959 [Nelumbo nucifera]